MATIKIFKWQLNTGHLAHTDILAPEGVLFLKIMSQEIHTGERIPTLWAEVNLNNKLAQHRIYCVGTGHPLPENWQLVVEDGPIWEYLDSVISGQHDEWVWHFYAWYGGPKTT